jgi:hypothetical protein
MWLEQQQQQQQNGQYPADAAGYAAFGSSSMQLAAVPQVQGPLRWPGAASSDYSGTPDSLQAEVMKLKAEVSCLVNRAGAAPSADETMHAGGWHPPVFMRCARAHAFMTAISWT